MADITKYLLDYNFKNEEVTKKRNQNNKNMEDNNIEDIEINSEEELNNNINIKKKTKKNKYIRLNKDNLKWNPVWMLKYPWLYYEKKNEKVVLFCKICKDTDCTSIWITTSSEQLKEDCIEQYENQKNMKKH